MERRARRLRDANRPEVPHGMFRAREVGSRIGLMREGRWRHIVDAAEITASELESMYLEELGRAAA